MLNGAFIKVKSLSVGQKSVSRVTIGDKIQSVSDRVWVRPGEVVLSGSDLKAAVGSILHTLQLPGMQVSLPEYLVQQEGALPQEPNLNNPKVRKDLLQIVRPVIEAIPSRYFYRRGVGTVGIRFNKAGMNSPAA